MSVIARAILRFFSLVFLPRVLIESVIALLRLMLRPALSLVSFGPPTSSGALTLTGIPIAYCENIQLGMCLPLSLRVARKQKLDLM